MVPKEPPYWDNNVNWDTKMPNGFKKAELKQAEYFEAWIFFWMPETETPIFKGI